MLRRILSSSRYMIAIAVIGSFLASIVTLIYGGISVIGIIINIFSHGDFTANGGKSLAVESIEVIDLFLLGTVLYIVALGLYELFIDDRLLMPSWLVISDLDDLKTKLTGVIIVLLAVTFLANVVSWDGSANILALGLSIGLVLFALGFLLSTSFKPRHAPQPEEQGVEK
jgi:uncharacterized membrane protein YqhA